LAFSDSQFAFGIWQKVIHKSAYLQKSHSQIKKLKIIRRWLVI
tara:strand:- start:159 stop:287 length:129 start_codon:yes stop_codon:yes gene_type:complete